MDKLKRLWGVRHIRAACLAWKLSSWWHHYGRHLGAVINEADIQYILDVRAGRR